MCLLNRKNFNILNPNILILEREREGERGDLGPYIKKAL